MAVYPDSFAIEAGLGGIFRQTLIDEDFVSAVWPLHELAPESVSAVAQDITGNHHDGTYVGTAGFTRGVTTGLPEGGVCPTFDGNGYIEVPDDGGAGIFGPLNLSLEDGDIDIVFLIKTSHNSATNRAIVQKMVTDATGNGYSVSLQSGAIRFRMEVGGVEQFNFSRGSVSDGVWHLVHCSHLSGPGEARILIDGVQSGATVSGVTTETDYTSVALRIGMWTNGVAGDGSGFIGTLAMVMLGREGNLSLSTSLQAARSWTAITGDVRAAQDIQIRYGIPGRSFLDNVGRPPMMTFALNNAATNSGGLLGYYSPGHANCRSGFGIGIPIRYSVTYGGTTRYKFRGTLKAVYPIAGEYGERLSVVTCEGWLSTASGVSVASLRSQANIASHNAVKLVIDQAEGRSPAAVDISSGSSTFPLAFEAAGGGGQESLLTELTRITASERGFLYEIGDTVQGGTVRWEGRGDRQIATTLDATFSNTMHGLEVRYSLDSLVNIVRVVVTPRRVDAAATTVLYALEASQAQQQIAPGQTIVLEGNYRNPTSEDVEVGGVDMVAPVASTDYAFWSNSDGTGADLTADLDIVSDLGGKAFRVEITNTGSMPGYLRLSAASAFQIRGKGVYHQPQVTVERRDQDSVRRHGPRTIQVDLAYESSVATAESVADFILGVLSQQRPIPQTLTLLANQNSTLLTQALAREPGDKIGIVETVTGVTTDDPDSDTSIGYFINEVDFRYRQGGMVSVTWTLAPSAPTGAGIFDVSAFDEDMVFGF